MHEGKAKTRSRKKKVQGSKEVRFGKKEIPGPPTPGSRQMKKGRQKRKSTRLENNRMIAETWTSKYRRDFQTHYTPHTF